MSNSKMLIDATHPEETRVVVQRNGRVEEFDFESAARKLLRGNIYLAKVTRVEPSLQAAFVDYGGNRHGFLAFNEIHPDYYQIPVADRQALIDEEAAAEAELEAAADRRAEALERRSRQRRGGDEGAQPATERDGAAAGAASAGEADFIEIESAEISNIVDVEEDEHIEEIGGEDGEEEAPATFAAITAPDEKISEPAPEPDVGATPETAPEQSEEPPAETGERAEFEGARDHAIDDREPPAEAGEHDAAGETAENNGNGGDLLEEVPVRPRRRPRSYKIQEVIKRRQVILVQVVKEERGNKGAALTTYLSLAGRYTVLMPNTARGGGISRKITNPQDRKRLKAIAQELDVPEGMGLIIRTAGAARTKQEIKRDFEYLLRLWESVRDLTLQSTAPSLVYEEGDLIKRSIRDLYNKDVEEVVVAGEGGYREAADFMRMLLPSHSKNVIEYNDAMPLFARYGVERQLNAMFSPQVTLRSGGYIVINQTEALVAIDVNSGKSTREFSIEETALATNLEAADEIARQLKLRDLAGLIVIDFIDMEEKRNNRAVERRLKDALRHDRARIQLGRISHFGLMEMSRQRLRTGVLEGSTSQCPHCQGTGIIRSTESVALAVLRGLEDTITAGTNAPLVATTTTAVALYILNSKRAYVADMEARHGYSVTVLGSDRVHGANFTVERGQQLATAAIRQPERAAVNMDWGFEGEGDEEAPTFESGVIDDVSSDGEHEPEANGHERQGRESREEDGGRRRRRRRRRGGRRGERDDGRQSGSGAGDLESSDSIDADDDLEETHAQGSSEDEGAEAFEPATAGEGAREQSPEGNADDAEEGGERRRRRRRGRRGGRRGRGDRDGSVASQSEDQANQPGEEPDDAQIGDNDEVDFGKTVRPAAPGLEPQPDVSFENSEGAPRQKSGRERRRPERLWDVHASLTEVETSADASAEAPAPETPSIPARAEPQPPAVATADPVATAAEPEPARKRHETGSSEPRIERVVVRPDEAAAGHAEPAQPQRKGWWQRRFGE